MIEVVPQGQLIPPDEESYNHGARTCRVSDDGKLYVTLGQPYNVQPRDKVAMYEKLGIGGIIRLNAFDGSGREVVARGVRNSVGMDINPRTRSFGSPTTRPTAWVTRRRPANSTASAKRGASTSATRTFMATVSRSRVRRPRRTSRT